VKAVKFTPRDAGIKLDILFCMTIKSILASIDSEIAKLKQARALLSNDGFGKDAPFPLRTRRKLSAAARKRIGDAQRKRWAKKKGSK
jgi:hypothetical protein